MTSEQDAPLALELDLDPRIHYALHQNDVPVVKELRLRHSGSEDLHDLEVQLELGGDLAQPWSRRIDVLRPGTVHRLQVSDLRLDPQRLRSQEEREVTELVARVTVAAPAARDAVAAETAAAETAAADAAADVSESGSPPPAREIARTAVPVEVLAFREWSGLRSLPELLAAFVLPNNPVVEDLLAATATQLAQATGSGSVDGYQSQDSERVRALVAATYRALRGLQIRYCNPPASFEEEGQKVRLPGDIHEHRLGTCLDLTLLAAAVLEQAGLAPLVVLVHGHAFVGVWLTPGAFAECVVLDAVRLRKRIDVGDVLVFDAVGVADPGIDDFAAAVAAAREHLDDEATYHCAVDVGQARVQRVRPLPTRAQSPTGVEPHSGDAARAAAGRSLIDQELPQTLMGVVPDGAAPPEEEFPETLIGRQDAVPADEPPLGPPRLETWKRHLLDLTYRNRLLAFRESKRTIPLLTSDAARLEDALADGGWFACAPKPDLDHRGASDTANLSQGADAAAAAPTREQLEQEVAAAELGRRRLVTGLTEKELGRRALEVWRSHRAGLEETGANTLFLALGMLRYREATGSRGERSAPLLLLPVEMERQSVREGFRLRLADEEPQVNVTLLEKLRQEFPIDVTGLDALPTDDDGYDVAAVLQNFRRAVVDVEGMEVDPAAWLAVFSFQKFLMWRDLQARAGDLLENPVVAHLVERAGSGFEAEAEFPEPAGLDAAHRPHDTLCPLDADSSQLAAVFAAAAGRSFVLQGPPGTGKSQTITNLIAQCLAEGRRVLFVSEKRAALEVVRDRLGRVGLGPFCLELHSNKARKRDVLDQLAELVDLERVPEPTDDWQRLADDLEAERVALNGFVDAIHGPRALGESVFDVTAELCGLREAPLENLGWSSERLSQLDRDSVDACRRAVERMVTSLRALGSVGPDQHPLRGIGQTTWRATLTGDVDAALDAAVTASGAHAAALEQSAGRLGFAVEDLTHARCERLVDLAALLPQAPPGIGLALLEQPRWSELRGRALAAVEAGRARDQLRAHVRRHFVAGVERLDLAGLRAAAGRAASSPWPLSWWRGRSVKSALQPVVAAGASLGSFDAIASHLAQVEELCEQDRALGSDAHDGALLFAHMDWNRGDPGNEQGWQQLADAVEFAGRLRTVLRDLVDGLDEERRQVVLRRTIDFATVRRDEVVETGAAVGREFDQLRSAAAACAARRSELDSLLAIEDGLFADVQATQPDAGSWPAALLLLLHEWRDQQRPLLRDWVFWRETRAAASEAGLDSLVAAVERPAPVAAQDLPRLFERSFREAWWNRVHDAEPMLHRFHGADHQRRIERFRELDQQATELTQACVRARLMARVPRLDKDGVASSELGVLQREIGKKRRHLPVRRLFERIPNLLPRLKPCVLMSPLSVAQYLDPAGPPFDLVVFDEASQITVPDSVGALARGRAAVVVGDSKQLPPTSFFQTEGDEDVADDLDLQELESILDECSAAGFRNLRLDWHYRSRHESLIAFSNYHYYDNDLHTFPSPAEQVDGLGVSLVRVTGGYYDRSETRTNRAEAESVVADLVRRLGVQGEQRSFGVVTFSRAQQELIEDLLDAARAADPKLEPFFHGDEPVFVKNLENVQGDERDVILFSICYGPDVNGKVAMNFGPLNLTGGERRLNVAVTRARRQVIVHATLAPEQIDLSRTAAVGVHHLRTFLEYAARGPSALAEAGEHEAVAAAGSPFESRLRAALEARGHDVETKVGCSGYRIDLALRDPERPGRYLLGIECDGAFYRSARNARDRDRIRAAVLEGLGWQLERVWSVDWWRSPERELDRLDAAIERARARAEDGLPDSVPELESALEPESTAATASSDVSESADDSESSDAPDSPDGADEVQESPPRYAAAGTAAEVEANESTAAADEVVGAADAQPAEPYPNEAYQPVDRAAPVANADALLGADAADLVQGVAAELLAAEAPLKPDRMVRCIADAFDARLTSRTRQRIEELLAAAPPASRGVESGDCIWHPSQDPASYGAYRSGGGRDADDLPQIERINAARGILHSQVALPREELVREMVRRFGFSRSGSRLQAAMEDGIDALLASGGAVADGEQIVVVG